MSDKDTKEYGTGKSTIMIFLGPIIYFFAVAFTYGVGSSRPLNERLADPEYIATFTGSYLAGPLAIGLVSLIVSGLIYWKDKNYSKFYRNFAVCFFGLLTLVALEHFI